MLAQSAGSRSAAKAYGQRRRPQAVQSTAQRTRVKQKMTRMRAYACVTCVLVESQMALLVAITPLPAAMLSTTTSAPLEGGGRFASEPIDTLTHARPLALIVEFSTATVIGTARTRRRVTQLSSMSRTWA